MACPYVVVSLALASFTGTNVAFMRDLHKSAGPH